LVSFDPEKDDPSKFVKDKILPITAIKNPRNIFSDASVSESDVSNYCREIERKVKYFLSQKDFELVSYYLSRLIEFG